MKQILKIADFCGTELRTRKVMENFAQTLNRENEYIFDMQGVEQISRSAADELYNITHTFQVEVIGTQPFVQKMLDAVTLGRFQPRDRHISDTPIIECPTMSSVCNFLRSNAAIV